MMDLDEQFIMGIINFRLQFTEKTQQKIISEFNKYRHDIIFLDRKQAGILSGIIYYVSIDNDEHRSQRAIMRSFHHQVKLRPASDKNNSVSIPVLSQNYARYKKIKNGDF